MLNLTSCLSRLTGTAARVRFGHAPLPHLRDRLREFRVEKPAQTAPRQSPSVRPVGQWNGIGSSG